MTTTACLRCGWWSSSFRILGELLTLPFIGMVCKVGAAGTITAATRLITMQLLVLLLLLLAGRDRCFVVFEEKGIIGGGGSEQV